MGTNLVCSGGRLLHRQQYQLNLKYFRTYKNHFEPREHPRFCQELVIHILLFGQRRAALSDRTWPSDYFDSLRIRGDHEEHKKTVKIWKRHSLAMHPVCSPAGSFAVLPPNCKILALLMLYPFSLMDQAFCLSYKNNKKMNNKNNVPQKQYTVCDFYIFDLLIMNMCLCGKADSLWAGIWPHPSVCCFWQGWSGHLPFHSVVRLKLKIGSLLMNITFWSENKFKSLSFKKE